MLDAPLNSDAVPCGCFVSLRPLRRHDQWHPPHPTWAEFAIRCSKNRRSTHTASAPRGGRHWLTASGRHWRTTLFHRGTTNQPNTIRLPHGILPLQCTRARLNTIRRKVEIELEYFLFKGRTCEKTLHNSTRKGPFLIILAPLKCSRRDLSF